MNIEYNFLKGWSLLKDSYQFNYIEIELNSNLLEKKANHLNKFRIHRSAFLVSNVFIPKRGIYTDYLVVFFFACDRQTSVICYGVR